MKLASALYKMASAHAMESQSYHLLVSLYTSVNRLDMYTTAISLSSGLSIWFVYLKRGFDPVSYKNKFMLVLKVITFEVFVIRIPNLCMSENMFEKFAKYIVLSMCGPYFVVHSLCCSRGTELSHKLWCVAYWWRDLNYTSLYKQ